MERVLLSVRGINIDVHSKAVPETNADQRKMKYFRYGMAESPLPLPCKPIFSVWSAMALVTDAAHTLEVRPALFGNFGADTDALQLMQ